MRAFLVAACLISAVPLAAQPIEIRLQGGFANPALRIGENYALKQGDVAREVLVIAGDATIDGTVDRDVVVILGKVQVSGTAVVHGSMIVVGGTVTAADGAQVREDLVVIGGFEGAPAFTPGGQQIVIGTTALGERLRDLVPWLTGGLLLARPIVPGLWWIWPVAGVFFLINLLLNLIFDTPVRAAAVAMKTTPLSAFMTGLLGMLLAGPVCLLLAVSVIGVAVIPFVLCALLIATVLGKVAFARWIGMSVIHEPEEVNRLISLRSFLIGSVIMCIAYMIPVIGFVTWSMAAVYGLGASMLAFGAAYRREHPRKPKPPKPAPAVTVPPSPAAVGVDAPAGAMPLVAIPEGGLGTDVPLAAAVEGPNSIPAVPAVIHSGGLLSYPRGAFLDRLGALALDFILVVIVAQVLDLDRHVDAPLGRLGLVWALAYHVGFWTWKGTTLGGIICNLRLVRTDGAPLQFPECVVRGLAGFFSLAVAGLGFFWILRDPERQGWHDRVAGTYVVKVPRAYPL